MNEILGKGYSYPIILGGGGREGGEDDGGLYGVGAKVGRGPYVGR